MPLGGVQVGSYDSYEQAQAAVDYLADEKFAVENVTIIGTDLRMVEKVTGRLSRGRAIGARVYPLNRLNEALADAEAMRLPKAIVDPHLKS